MSAQSYLLRGGQVYTMDPGRPWAQCVVVRGKMITYVGPEAGAVLFTDSGTEVIEVGGGMVLPGFIDGHNHLAGSGAMAKLGVEINGLSDPAEMLARIRDYAASCPDSAVIRLQRNTPRARIHLRRPTSAQCPSGNPTAA